MMEDVNAGISWVLKRIRHYGGDPDRVYLVGQSCGAQLSTMCLVTQVCGQLILLLQYISERNILAAVRPSEKSRTSFSCCTEGQPMIFGPRARLEIKFKLTFGQQNNSDSFLSF